MEMHGVNKTKVSENEIEYKKNIKQKVDKVATQKFSSHLLKMTHLKMTSAQ